ncbi:MAG: alpha-amylase family glycosyl hydrolase [Butyrivibrio sp.]|nr:alpha-amylase family glycosyl hydrolase [Acetatifactor muris]MCM1561024.1 alpha-amylase family glycosyl hydrolase [Butyrivibrio sp.]
MKRTVHLSNLGRRIACGLLAAGMMTGLAGCGEKPAEVDGIDDNYRVFYEIFTGSFSDSDGDGIGDLRGIINRMDYLNDGNINSGESLGIQGIWLTPIFSSPSYHKYDVADYYKIDSDFGTQEDLTELFTVCHERNVKVILDLVLNHTSSSNPWFMSFTDAHKNGDTSSPYYDYYTWVTKDTQVSGRTYRQIPGCADEYYECNFSGDMPELNYDNETVRQEALKIAKYYIDLGADGFRFDAIKYIYYNDTDRSSEFWRWYMNELRAYKEDIYCVGECWSSDQETLEYVDSLNCFNFQVGQGEGVLTKAVRNGQINAYTGYIESYQDKVLAENSEGGMICNFLANHDTDRAAGFLNVSTGNAHMAANLLILCSGSPFIYYGEEIGMKGTRGAANTDANRRLAMLWGDGDTVKDPVGSDFPSDKQQNGTVADQLSDENSLYHYYAEVIAVRNRHPEIARGDYAAVSSRYSELGGFEITCGDSVILLLHNTSAEEIEIDLSSMTGVTGEYKRVTDSVGLGGGVSLKGSTLKIGARTSAILEK